jgi:hypothetical protein
VRQNCLHLYIGYTKKEHGFRVSLSRRLGFFFFLFLYLILLMLLILLSSFIKYLLIIINIYIYTDLTQYIFILIYIWGNYTLPPEVSTHFHFYLQSLKCDTLPPQTFKLWQFNPFGLFIPKMPPTLFFFSKKKFQKKNPKKI